MVKVCCKWSHEKDRSHFSVTPFAKLNNLRYMLTIRDIKKPLQLDCKGLGGADEARTRDPRRDRPVF